MSAYRPSIASSSACVPRSTMWPCSITRIWCASATDVAIGRAFFDAAHERGYREAFVFQRKIEDAVACAEAQLKLVGEGLAAQRKLFAGIR